MSDNLEFTYTLGSLSHALRVEAAATKVNVPRLRDAALQLLRHLDEAVSGKRLFTVDGRTANARQRRAEEVFRVESNAGSKEVIGWDALLLMTRKKEKYLRVAFSTGRGVASFGTGEHHIRITRLRDVERISEGRAAEDAIRRALENAGRPSAEQPKSARAPVAPTKKPARK